MNEQNDKTYNYTQLAAVAAKHVPVMSQALMQLQGKLDEAEETILQMLSIIGALAAAAKAHDAEAEAAAYDSGYADGFRRGTYIPPCKSPGAEKPWPGRRKQKRELCWALAKGTGITIRTYGRYYISCKEIVDDNEIIYRFKTWEEVYAFLQDKQGANK